MLNIFPEIFVWTAAEALDLDISEIPGSHLWRVWRTQLLNSEQQNVFKHFKIVKGHRQEVIKQWLITKNYTKEEEHKMLVKVSPLSCRVPHNLPAHHHAMQPASANLNFSQYFCTAALLAADGLQKIWMCTNKTCSLETDFILTTLSTDHNSVGVTLILESNQTKTRIPATNQP